MTIETIKDLEFYSERNNQILNAILVHHDIDSNTAFLRLLESIRYSLISKMAKRLRPTLVYAVGESMHTPLPQLDMSAAAVELIHTASLVHDDLPALDDDDTRRGRPTCHQAFGEDTAILAGDAMQSLAFEILTSAENSLSPTQQIKSVQILASAYGVNDIMKGQMLDLYALESNDTSVETLQMTYRLKTASLIKAALFLGAIAADCQDQKIFDTLAQFAENIGLAYQIQDDILDVEIDQKEQSDQKVVTYPSIVGVEESKLIVKSLYEDALMSLKALPFDVKLLETIAKRMIFRTY